MAEAKIIIEAISDNTGIKDLSSALGEAQAKLKETQKKLRDAEKAGNLTNSEMKALRAEFNQQKIVCSQLNAELKKTANAITQTGKDASGLKDSLKGMVSDKLGLDLDGLVGKFSGTSAAMLSVVTAATTMSAALVNSARELSSFSNQFVAFAGDVRKAKLVYDEFNQVYRNTNYDEQKVYDMGKAFLSLGMSAKESAALVMECADAAASVGRGAEFADELAAAFKRLYTGGELTERQLKSMAEAGIDLSSVQDEIRAGGIEAYEALKEKLGEYEGGMNRTKQTAAEMEGDIKGNLVEIGRQTADLIDEVFGFSEALRGFYQWLIDVTQATIDSIKACMAAFGRAKASADAYSSAVNSLGEEYDEVMEAAAQGDKAAIERLNTIQAQAAAEAELAKQAEAVRQEEEKAAALASSRPQVQSIAKTSGGGSAGGAGGRDTAAIEEAKAQKKLQQEIAKIAQETIRIQEQQYAAEQRGVQILNQKAQIGKTGLELDKLKYEQDMANYDEQIRRTKELTDAKIKAIEDVKAATQQAIDEGLAPDGSQQKIDKLNEEIIALQNLGAQQVKNIEDEKAAREQAYGDNSGLANSDPGANVSLDTINGFSAAIDNIRSKWGEFSKQIGVDSPQLKMAFNLVAVPFGNMVDGILSGTKSASEAMKQFAKQMITAALNMLAQWLALTAIFAAFGVPSPGSAAAKMVLGDYTKKRDGGIVHAANGGYISGPGSNRSDSVPAMLSDGEFVMNANAVNAIGADNLARINAAGSTADDVAGFGGRNVTMNISAVDASSFGDFLGRGGLGAIKQALYDDDRQFGSAVGVW